MLDLKLFGGLGDLVNPCNGITVLAHGIRLWYWGEWVWLLVLHIVNGYKRGQRRVFRHTVNLREIKRSESDLLLERVIFSSERE